MPLGDMVGLVVRVLEGVRLIVLEEVWEIEGVWEGVWEMEGVWEGV